LVDRLEQASRAARPRCGGDPVGTLPLGTAEERAHAHAQVKRHVKELPHVKALAATDEPAPPPPAGRRTRSSAGMRALARAASRGAHSRTHPRFDRIPRDMARAELLDLLRDLEREIPDAARVRHPDGRFDDELVDLARAAQELPSRPSA
jgi:peptidoglycan/xylan/chitin deacetylase (PgdA/CDA1 family)